MARIGSQLVQEKKSAVLAAGNDKSAAVGRDLLSVLGEGQCEVGLLRCSSRVAFSESQYGIEYQGQ